MDMQAIKDEILLQLTGDITELELSDTSLTKIINSSLRELQRYIDTAVLIKAPFQKCIDMKPFNVSSVIGVRRSEGFLVTSDGTQGAVMDPMYASQWQMMNGLGRLNNISDYAYNYASWNTILQIKNTVSTDMSHYYDKQSEKLYINISSNIPEHITIIAIPRFTDVSQITSDYWIDILVRMATAKSRVIVGTVRNKFKQSNALWAMDGDDQIAQGKEELDNLRTSLEANSQLVYGID